MTLAQALIVVQAAAAAEPQIEALIRDVVQAFRAKGQVSDEQLASARAAAQASISSLERQVLEDLKA